MTKQLIVDSDIGIFADHMPELQKKGSAFNLLVDCAKYHIDKILNEYPDFEFIKCEMKISERYFIIGKIDLFYIFKSND